MSEIRKTLLNYEVTPGRYPFDEWLKNLKDRKGRSIILARLDRLQMHGHFGDHRVLGPGLIELKVDFGPGYRVYLGEDGPTLIILLCGGDKKSQNKDIRTAEEYWQNYRNRRTK